MQAYYMIYPWKGSRCCYRIITEEDTHADSIIKHDLTEWVTFKQRQVAIT